MGHGPAVLSLAAILDRPLGPDLGQGPNPLLMQLPQLATAHPGLETSYPSFLLAIESILAALTWRSRAGGIVRRGPLDAGQRPKTRKVINTSYMQPPNLADARCPGRGSRSRFHGSTLATPMDLIDMGFGIPMSSPSRYLCSIWSYCLLSLASPSPASHRPLLLALLSF